MNRQQDHDLFRQMAEQFINAGPRNNPPPIGREIPIEYEEVDPSPQPADTKLQPAERHEEPGDRIYISHEPEQRTIEPEQRTITLTSTTHFVNVLTCWGLMAALALPAAILPKNALLLNLMKVAPLVAAIAFLFLGTRAVHKGSSKWQLSVLLAASTAFHFVVAFTVLAR